MPDDLTPGERRTVTWLAVLSTVFHAVLLILSTGQPTFGAAGLGLLVSGVLWIANMRRAQPVVLRFLAVSLLLAWLVQDMMEGAQARSGATVWVLLDTVMCAAVILALVPLRWATWTLGGLYALFLTGVLLAGEKRGLLLLYMAFLLIALRFLSEHGRLVSLHRSQRDALAAQLRRDALTGAATRDVLDEAVRDALGHPGHALIMVDVDHFKAVNDQYGHLTGDRTLRHVARVLREAVRPGDVVCRWGGEEFVVLLRDVTLVDARRLAESVRMRVEAGEHGGSLPDVTVSVGVASLDGVHTLEEALSRVDERLYAAKEAGRNRVRTS